MGLMRESGIKFYCPIIKAKIPFHNAPLDEVEDFVHASAKWNIGESSRNKPYSLNEPLLHKTNENSSDEDSTIRTPKR
ncbi:16932_t:CDS:2 [Cetraspora pellucida]|uniref:16932_t:CDS:1 n=1 Tax=Cetraspora pellucida TaxID=1433469 RepID=A0ACA9KLN6_9GLOM|nr:16932_t:CDS:2 [Cetraspora pellucida]